MKRVIDLLEIELSRMIERIEKAPKSEGAFIRYMADKRTEFERAISILKETFCIRPVKECER